MKTQARVVVIGGGVVGVSTLYHLALKGWSDVVLVERKELTSGSTWHAAGLLPLFNMSYSVGQLHKYAVKLYKTLEKETGQDVGFKVCSNIRLASKKERMDEYHQYAGVAQTIGVDVNFLSPKEVKEIWPLCNIENLIGAIQHPEDGYIQPADLTQALAKGARKKGAEIYRGTTVIDINKKSNGEWIVKTDKGEITCEHIVSASGNFARQTGSMVGLNIPVIPVEHQFIVTEPHQEILKRHKEGLPEMGVLRDSEGQWYMREEAGGLLLGPYEKGAPCCYVNGPGKDSEYELFQEDLERLEPHIESAIFRVPAFGEVGVKKVYNGAITYTPDGNPIVGPAWGLKNYWINEGHSFGITAAGGAGWQLAEWIIEGEPTVDMLGVEPRRFGDYATKSYLIKKNEEAYANVFTIHYPDEERAAGRPLRQAPCYDRLKNLGAVFGQKFGWERANWFAPSGTPQVDDWSFRRSRWFEHVGNECNNVKENVGILDMTAFAKCRVSGQGAESFLDGLVANRLPQKNGRVNLCHALNSRGGVHSEFTITRESDESFYLVSAGAFQRLDHDWIKRWIPNDGSVQFENITNSIGVLVVAGPKSRDLLSRVSNNDYSNEQFPWLTSKAVDIGLAPSLAIRMNFVGEMGWELHHPIEYQNHIFDNLMVAGQDLGLKPFGIRAMDSLRIEKSYKLVGTELSIEYSAIESGLNRFVHLNKGNFIGRDSLVKWQQKGFSNQFVTLEVHNITDADALGNNPIFHKNKVVGRATGGNFGFRIKKSIMLGMVDPEFSSVGTKLTTDILGTKHPVSVIKESPYDPDNKLLRG
ncbi:MAG: 4-methylaminobutanoate oxidase (formaldehyde-forming) [Alphaproteobacteria bacterium MarineAlpha5_Bin11]|nr:dimethylglycine dehydrogenase [Pelagibacteraceae bacterium]PPR44479.1 MAG: 4-methylaminobutanoate oxidase (formaldehyde-forming) [Alphaproteobacteria bacterium MarineAlpha5_Bin11]PPR51169.1 MAG: 4-methylaminobutanoate oxidase (formaldehyde-forming) [Alphaproteobacteria bacterium MarineAlpha5_Bin10]|tara:strand:- start:7427 stop:9862 length:2436 start_codon:yes stop_codon:yes gene_type:complete